MTRRLRSLVLALAVLMTADQWFAWQQIIRAAGALLVARETR